MDVSIRAATDLRDNAWGDRDTYLIDLVEINEEHSSHDPVERCVIGISPQVASAEITSRKGVTTTFPILSMRDKNDASPRLPTSDWGMGAVRP